MINRLIHQKWSPALYEGECLCKAAGHFSGFCTCACCVFSKFYNLSNLGLWGGKKGGGGALLLLITAVIKTPRRWSTARLRSRVSGLTSVCSRAEPDDTTATFRSKNNTKQTACVEVHHRDSPPPCFNWQPASFSA